MLLSTLLCIAYVGDANFGMRKKTICKKFHLHTFGSRVRDRKHFVALLDSEMMSI